MRPRVFPAEDADVVGDAVQLSVASMRPRVFPAEDSPANVSVRSADNSFNEAAGIPRGRHAGGSQDRANTDMLQ